MAKRDRYYGKFGPRAIEAIVNTVLAEINRLRTNAGLQERTKEQMLDALEEEHASLPSYDFEEEAIE